MITPVVQPHTDRWLTLKWHYAVEVLIADILVWSSDISSGDQNNPNEDPWRLGMKYIMWFRSDSWTIFIWISKLECLARTHFPRHIINLKVKTGCSNSAVAFHVIQNSRSRGSDYLIFRYQAEYYVVVSKREVQEILFPRQHFDTRHTFKIGWTFDLRQFLFWRIKLSTCTVILYLGNWRCYDRRNASKSTGLKWHTQYPNQPNMISILRQEQVSTLYSQKLAPLPPCFPHTIPGPQPP
jgi:hypothetical protein